MLAFLLALPFIATAMAVKPRGHPHNLNHPHRHLLKRSITADVSQVSGASFDFIIAGGGVAGLTLGARLSEWSNVTVLVIEAGGDGSDVEDKIDIPGYSYLNSLTGTAYDWAYNTVAQVDSLGLTKYWPRGKGLGGSGAINGLFWCRASSTEYDAWATLNPNAEQTWDWAEVNKYMMKAENFSTPNTTVQEYFGMNLNTSAHGSGGPIQAGFSEYIFDSVKEWIPTWVSLGFTSKDLAGGSTHGVTITPSTLNMHNQTRSDSKAGYIDPLPPRSNLVILTGQQVTEVIFSDTKDSSGNLVASGVKFQANSTESAYTVEANKEVILAGGTVGSPQILQLSGVGPSSLMTALGIKSQLDLPVGYNLQDHISYTMYWSTPQGLLTWGNLSASASLQASELAEYKDSATGMWTYINEAVGYPSMTDITGSSAAASTYATTVQSAIAATVSDVTSWMTLPDTVATGLTAQYNLMQQWLTEETGQLEILLTMLGNGDKVTPNTLGIQVALQHPWSRGTIMINSTDAFVQPNINPDYFGVGYDIDIMGYGSNFARTLAKTSPLSTVMLTESLPGATVLDDALANYTKQNAGTEYHPLGTCAMLPQASGGVVDTNLLVYGSANLRVIDASIMPMELSSHLMASTYGVAEKGADIVKQKYWAAVNDTATSTTAAIGTATNTQVTEATSAAAGNNNLSSTSAGMSTTARIGVGVGVGAGALALLAALLIFCCVRRKKNAKAAPAKGWYNGANNEDHGAWDTAAAYKEGYPMSNFQTADLAAPVAPYSHNRTMSASPSVNTIATADLPAGMPHRPNSESNFAGYAQREGAASPYRDDDGGDYMRAGMGQGGYGQVPPPQRYHPVNMR
ncbi:hypothetical protein P7C73_g3120, partial [Tremellales sp. Uapishka_1]